MVAAAGFVAGLLAAVPLGVLQAGAAAEVGAGAPPAGRVELVAATEPRPSSDPDPSAGSAPDQSPDQSADQRAERRAERRAEMDESIAGHLGVSVEQLREARFAALEERLDAAVDRGRITSEQADELLAAAREGRLRAAIRELRGELRAERRGGR